MLASFSPVLNANFQNLRAVSFNPRPRGMLWAYSGKAGDAPVSPEYEHPNSQEIISENAQIN